MKLLTAFVVVAVQLGGAFGAGSATVESLDEASMIIDIEVEVKATVQAVVAHLAFDDDPPLALPLLDRGEGVFGIRTELERKNYIVSFEALGAEEGLSPPVSLTQLGADLTPDLGDGTSSGEEDGLSPETRRLGWLALALAAASLSALAVWTLGGRSKSEEPDPDTSEQE